MTTEIRHKKPSPPVQERSLRTREQIEAAALDAFAELGYEGASTRLIADQAGVKQQLITYHYGSKLDLWKAVVTGLFTTYRTQLESRLKGLSGVDAQTRARLLIHDYLAYCAEHPQIARLMIHEGGTLTPRLSWLYETHTKALIEALQKEIKAARQQSGAPDIDIVQLTYILIGSTAMFSQQAEYRLLTGKSPNSEETIASYSQLLASLTLS